MTISPRLIMLLLVFCYAMWGGGMIAMKYAFTSFSAEQVIFARVGFAALAYLLIFPKWKNLPYQKGDWKFLAAMVAFEPCLFFVFETFSLKFTSASQGGIIAACFPICTAIAGWFFLKEKLGRRTIVAIALAVAGVAGTSYFAETSETATNPLLGNMLMLAAVLSSTGYAVTVRYVSRRYSFLSISAIQAIGGAIAFLPLLFTSPIPEQVSIQGLAGLLYMGIGVGLLVYLSFNFALQHLEAGVVALFGNLIPIFTLIFAFILLDERLNLLQTGSVFLVLLGVFIASSEKR